MAAAPCFSPLLFFVVVSLSIRIADVGISAIYNDPVTQGVSFTILVYYWFLERALRGLLFHADSRFVPDKFLVRGILRLIFSESNLAFIPFGFVFTFIPSFFGMMILEGWKAPKTEKR
jgi:hypothetical protein